MKAIIKCSIVGAVLAVSSAARATPVPLPFTYPYETLEKGALEIEFYGDMTPRRVLADPTDASKGRLWEPGYVLQNEFEYGVSDHVELAPYPVVEATPLDGGTNAMTLDGFKFRVRARLAEADEWPVDVALYLELETLHDEYGLEEKLILAKHMGPLHWMTNLWVEQSYGRPFDASQRHLDFVVNPTTGLTYEAAPWFQPGVEYWARGEFGTHGDTPVDRINNRIHHFAAPTVHFD